MRAGEEVLPKSSHCLEKLSANWRGIGSLFVVMLYDYFELELSLPERLFLTLHIKANQTAMVPEHERIACLNFMRKFRELLP